MLNSKLENQWRDWPESGQSLQSERRIENSLKMRKVDLTIALILRTERILRGSHLFRNITASEDKMPDKKNAG